MGCKSPLLPTISSATTDSIDAVREYSPKALRAAIEWSYFYYAWGLRENHPQAASLRAEAETLLRQFEVGGTVARAAFSLRPAWSDGDDIVLPATPAHPAETRLCFLRQQHPHRGTPCLCLSDFVAPPGALSVPLTARFVGLFATAVTPAAAATVSAACPCCHPRSCPPRRDSAVAVAGTSGGEDDAYTAMLRQTVLDRMAEAAASLLHREILQAFAPESVNPTVRPAVGYPSLPDQSLIFDLARCLPFRQLGISLTASGMMLPHASTCGIVFAHPAARYFDVGRVSADQFADYARRRHTTVEDLQRFFHRNLS